MWVTGGTTQGRSRPGGPVSGLRKYPTNPGYVEVGLKSEDGHGIHVGQLEEGLGVDVSR